MNRVSSIMSRVLFALAFALAGLAVWEKLTNLLGYRLTFLLGYTPSRLLELAVVALLFVIALQLRELKHLSSGGNRAADS
jgi:hypothetical protein